MKKVLVIGLTVLALVALAYTQRARLAPIDAGSKAPMFAEPGKVVVLNFWATWCIPCRREMPALERLASHYRGKGLDVVGVSADTKAEDAREYAEALGISFRLVHDADKSIQEKYQVTGLPTTFVIGKNGKVVERIIGAKPWDDTTHLRQFDKLLSE